jgi:hypothetical protein
MRSEINKLNWKVKQFLVQIVEVLFELKKAVLNVLMIFVDIVNVHKQK